MVKNQTRFEQRHVMQFLVAEKCEPCEIYRRICNMDDEVWFSPKNVYKWAKHGFATMNLTQKDGLWNENMSFDWRLQGCDWSEITIVTFTLKLDFAKKFLQNICQSFSTIVSKVKLATVIEGDQKAPFSIATTPKCRGGCYCFPRIAPLYPWYIPYSAEC